MAKVKMGFKCPRCQGKSYIRTSKIESSETVVRYYVCQEGACGFVFKTFHVFTRFICRPVPSDCIEQAPEQPVTRPVPDKTASHTMRLE